MRLAAISSVSAAILCAARFVSGCGPSSSLDVRPPRPVFSQDGGPELADSDIECRLMCANLAKLGCPESAIDVEPIDGGWSIGRTCESTCTAAQRHKRNLRPMCVANAGSPEGVRQCCPKGFSGCTPVTCEQ